jgi:drug/metabolite transporter (DMT)-like permease
MFFLLGSIILTSYLTLSFKVVERLRINMFQSIVFNYVACVITGSVFLGRFPVDSNSFSLPWFKWAILMGASFIAIFNIIGITTQKIGVAVASVANKLSLVIPFVFSIFLYNEKAGWLKIAGLLLALVAVYLTMKRQEKQESMHTGKWLFLFPVVLFFSSGLLDTMIKYVEQHFLSEASNNDYLITAFASAAVIGLVLLLFFVLTGKQQFDPRAIIAGLGIGIPNYFSIWCLLRVLKQYTGNSSAIMPINNMGIVLFSAVVAWLLFKENLSGLNWLGIILSLGAIALIAFG